MCTTCGCGTANLTIEGHAGLERDLYWHLHEDGSAHSHAPQVHENGHVDTGGRIYRHIHPHGHANHAHDLLSIGSVLHAHAPSLTQSRMVQIERDILSKNNSNAAVNRSSLENRGILVLNLVSSPGSGKTSLLVRTISELEGQLPIAVIEGDQQTANDADRIRAAGAPAIQINTGKGCHLDAFMVRQALETMSLEDDSLLFIENVGNLVCPAAFDLGEAAKVVILSVTEGEDKPLKYPDMFRASQLMLLNKCDLLPHLDFNVERVIENALTVNPAITVIRISATTGEGMDEWLKWLAREQEEISVRKSEPDDMLKRNSPN